MEAAMPRRLLSVLPTCLVGLSLVLLVGLTSSASADGGLPSERQWHHDVARAMRGSHAYLDRVTAGTHGPQAINLDIDNTALATVYRPGTATPAVLSFARHAQQHGVAVMFNTARTGAMVAKARRLLTHAGYTVDGLCSRRRGEAVTHSKQRCRRHVIAQGYTIVANVGNRGTDFAGAHNDGRRFHLPNYGGRLG
jgi:hypothetical protein